MDQIINSVGYSNSAEGMWYTVGAKFPQNRVNELITRIVKVCKTIKLAGGQDIEGIYCYEVYVGKTKLAEINEGVNLEIQFKLL